MQWTVGKNAAALTQSLSKMMTVSAAVRLMPRPPALVLSRNRNTSGSLEKFVICKEKNSREATRHQGRC